MSDDVKDSGAAPSAVAKNYDIPTSGPAYENWRKTGEVTPKSEASAASKETPSKEDSATSSDIAPASEAGKETQDKGTKRKLSADERIAQLEATIQKIKAGKETEAKKEAEPPAARPAPIAAKLEPPKEPSMEDPKYTGEDGWKKYEADIRQYTRDLAKYEAAIASKDAVEKYKQEQLQQKQNEQVAKEFAKAQEKYSDYKEKTQPLIDSLIAEIQAPPESKTIHPVILEAIGSNPLCADILYVIGPQKDEFLQLARTNPVAALEKVAVIKHLISEELAKTSSAAEAPRNEKGEFVSSPDKKITKAPPPAPEVVGRTSPPRDESEEAAKSGNTRAYIDAENARAIREKRRY